MFKIFRKSHIDHRLRDSLKPSDIYRFKSLRKDILPYRFVDFFRAAETLASQGQLKEKILSIHHGLGLGEIVRGDFPQHIRRSVNPSTMKMIAVAFETKESFPEECFWSFFDKNGKPGVLRVVSNEYTSYLEIAGESDEWNQETTEELEKISIRDSIYRNQFLQVDVKAPMQDEYDYGNSSQGMQVNFRKPPAITEDQIIFDPEVKKMVDRNIISFFRNRERLHELGLPLQRGVLFYGPPGTGKTYTCRYIYGQLSPVTTITVSGKGLGQVRTICSLARLLQPAVLVLEDVDLIFTSRKINLYSSELGDMMDELDAFKKEENVMFILTTNSIERLEEAIKDRPGRISQCIFFGPPTKELRVRYLNRYLRDQDTSQLSMEYVADISDGGSQAFLEELVYRAIQIAAEQSDTKIQLTDAIFKEAVDEMTSRNNKSAGSIVGFQAGK